ncbi:MAG: nucleotidyltransferase domain-containing protein, partial [archaeon]|nr:nucleotidyltransferase domain-containing protein [archaeon]
MSDKKPKSLTSEMNSPKKYAPNPVSQMPSAEKEEHKVNFEALKVKLESFKKDVLKKFKFTIALGLLPEPSFKIFEEDEELPKEVIDTKPMHMIMVIPEEEYKNIPMKIRPEVVKLIKETKENIWIHIKTSVDLWNYGLDSKFEFIDAISASFPLHDNGFLGALRVANIHKTLVLRKFEKYVASYVIAGSLVRGTADKDSDVDTFVIIDDTDVKKMTRVDLLDRLRGIIYDYIREASALAGVKNILNVQVYLLTDFWQSVKDAHPVMFTFIRDGIPLYDRGTFIPWKLLLKMGKIKPSPEAVDMFMKSGDQTKVMVDRRMLDAMVDVFWGITTPTQALMMIAGHAPPEPKKIVSEVRSVFVEKEKLMTEKDVATLEKVVKLYKDYEHGKLKEISGEKIDRLMEEANAYVKKIKELRKKLEIRVQEHSVENVQKEIIRLLKNIFGNKSEKALILDLNNKMIKEGKLPPRMLGIAKKTLSASVKAKKDGSQSETQRILGEASELVGALVEYSQRKDIVKAEKGIIEITYSGRKAEIVIAEPDIFVVEASSIKKIVNGKLVNSDKKEFEEALAKSKGKLHVALSSDVLETIRQALGHFD